MSPQALIEFSQQRASVKCSRHFRAEAKSAHQPGDEVRKSFETGDCSALYDPPQARANSSQ